MCVLGMVGDAVVGSVPPLHHRLNPHTGGRRPSQTKLKDTHRCHNFSIDLNLPFVVIVSMSWLTVSRCRQARSQVPTHPRRRGHRSQSPRRRSSTH
jgi:hypothetical protein